MERADEDFCEMLTFVVTAGKLRTYETDDTDDRAALDRAAQRYARAARDLVNDWAEGVRAPSPANE